MEWLIEFGIMVWSSGTNVGQEVEALIKKESQEWGEIALGKEKERLLAYISKSVPG